MLPGDGDGFWRADQRRRLGHERVVRLGDIAQIDNHGLAPGRVAAQFVEGEVGGHPKQPGAQPRIGVGQAIGCLQGAQESGLDQFLGNRRAHHEARQVAGHLPADRFEPTGEAGIIHFRVSKRLEDESGKIWMGSKP